MQQINGPSSTMSISYKCNLFSIVEIPTPFFSAEPKSMAVRSSWYHHPSSTMAMISPRLGIRRSALRLITSAHGSSSPSHLSFAAATDNKKVGTYTWSRTWYNKEGMQLGALVVLICFLYKLIGVWRPIERDSVLQRWEGGDDLRRVRRRPQAWDAVAREGLLPLVISIWILNILHLHTWYVGMAETRVLSD